MMFCCCAGSNDSNSSYNLGDEVATKKSKPSDVHIQTGKGPLSSSNQSIGPEATLDKATITATRRDNEIVSHQPVSEQPIQESEASTTNHSQPVPQLEQQGSQGQDAIENNSVDVSQVEAKIISAENKPVEKPVFVSTVNVKQNNNPNTAISSDKSMTEVSSINSRLNSLEQAITQAESKSAGQGDHSAVSDLVSQLKALNTQVLGVAASAENKMADKNLQGVVSRLESVATRLESLAVGGGAATGGGSGE